MPIKATLETRDKKDGSGKYKVVVLRLSDKSEKLVFLSPAELELLELYNSKSSSMPNLPDDDDWLK